MVQAKFTVSLMKGCAFSDLAEMFVIVKTLSAECLVAGLTLASQSLSVLLLLMVDKASMVKGLESTSFHVAMESKVGC
jgi:hypothetical protein